MIKEKLSLIIFVFFLILICFSILTSAKSFYSEIIETLTIWLYNVYPSIFTLYIISSSLINFNLISRLTFLFKPFIKFSSNKAYELFIISIIVGNPSTASLITSELELNTITKNDAKKLIYMSAFFNPLFIISLIIYSYLENILYAFLIVISMLITSIIFSQFFKYHNQEFKYEKKPMIIKFNKLFTSINSAMYLLIIIAGVMVFSNILKFSLLNLFTLIKVNNFYAHFFICNLEAAVGVVDIINLHLATPYTLSLVCFMLTFQGLSINIQVATVLKDFQLNLLSLLKIRLLQGLLSSLICFGLYLIFI